MSLQHGGLRRNYNFMVNQNGIETNHSLNEISDHAETMGNSVKRYKVDTFRIVLGFTERKITF